MPQFNTRSRRCRIPTSRSLIVEQLESRQLLALNVIGVIDSISESSSLYSVETKVVTSQVQAIEALGRGVFSPTSHPPLGTSSVRMNVMENQPYRIQLDDFGFSDPNDVPADKLYSVLITALPVYQGLEGGRLLLDGVPVSVGQEILASDIVANKLVFVPASTSIDTTRPHRNYVTNAFNRLSRE